MIVRFLERTDKYDLTKGIAFERTIEPIVWPIPKWFELIWPDYTLTVQSTGWDFSKAELVITCQNLTGLLPVGALSVEAHQEYINETIAQWEARGWKVVEG